jgi:hypothetical protein
MQYVLLAGAEFSQFDCMLAFVCDCRVHWKTQAITIGVPIPPEGWMPQVTRFCGGCLAVYGG